MNEHLTDEQLKFYVETTSNSVESIRLGRHLVQCEDCRRRMPPPTKEQFLEAIMTDIDEAVIEEANRLDGIEDK